MCPFYVSVYYHDVECVSNWIVAKVFQNTDSGLLTDDSLFEREVSTGLEIESSCQCGKSILVLASLQMNFQSTTFT